MKIFVLNNAYQDLSNNYTSIQIESKYDTPHPYFEVTSDFWDADGDTYATRLAESAMEITGVSMHEIMINSCRYDFTLNVECVIDNVTGQEPLYYYNVLDQDLDDAILLWINEEYPSEFLRIKNM